MVDLRATPRGFPHEKQKKRGSACVQAELASVGFGGSIDGEKITDLTIVDEATEYLRGNISTEIEKVVRRNFRRLIAETDLRGHVRRKFIIGVITKTVTGQLHAVAGKVKGTGMQSEATFSSIHAQQVAERRHLKSVELCRNGVIGANMVCFVVECDSKTERMRVSAPIHVVRNSDDGLRAAQTYVRCNISPLNILKCA